MNVAQREREMSSGGDLQRGSNVGGGQVRAADYVLVGEIASQNSNTGGGAVAGIAGAVLGGRAGALVGGLRTRNMEANTVLSLTSVRTSETVAVTEGYASRSNMSWGVGAGGFGAGALGGGAYENTEIGRIVAGSFIQAYTDMVTQLGGLSGNAAQDAPIRTYTVQQTSTMRSTPDSGGTVVRSLPIGLRLYPTGKREGAWWEVIDDNDNVGWVQNERLAPST